MRNQVTVQIWRREGDRDGNSAARGENRLDGGEQVHADLEGPRIEIPVNRVTVFCEFVKFAALTVFACWWATLYPTSLVYNPLIEFVLASFGFFGGLFITLNFFLRLVMPGPAIILGGERLVDRTEPLFGFGSVDVAELVYVKESSYAFGMLRAILFFPREPKNFYGTRWRPQRYLDRVLKNWKKGTPLIIQESLCRWPPDWTARRFGEEVERRAEAVRTRLRYSDHER